MAEMSDRITVYRIPEGAMVPCDAYQHSRPVPGPMPSGDYFASKGFVCGRACLIPLDYPCGAEWYWVERRDVEQFAIVFVPEVKPDGEGLAAHLRETAVTLCCAAAEEVTNSANPTPGGPASGG